MAYPEGLLTSGERVREHLRPHVRMLALPALVPPIVAGVAAWAAAALSRVSWHALAWAVLIVVAVVLVVRFSILPLLRWWCTHFVVTDRRLLVREGVLSRADVDVAGSSIVAVGTRRSGWDRMLGCGTLVVATRDARHDPWEFHGIPRLDDTAASLEEVAEERGGLVEPDCGDPDEAADDDSDDDSDDAPEDDDGWGPAPARISRGRAGRTSR